MPSCLEEWDLAAGFVYGLAASLVFCKWQPLVQRWSVWKWFQSKEKVSESYAVSRLRQVCMLHTLLLRCLLLYQSVWRLRSVWHQLNGKDVGVLNSMHAALFMSSLSLPCLVHLAALLWPVVSETHFVENHLFVHDGSFYVCYMMQIIQLLLGPQTGIHLDTPMLYLILNGLLVAIHQDAFTDCVEQTSMIAVLPAIRVLAENMLQSSAAETAVEPISVSSVVLKSLQPCLLVCFLHLLYSWVVGPREELLYMDDSDDTASIVRTFSLGGELPSVGHTTKGSSSVDTGGLSALGSAAFSLPITRSFTGLKPGASLTINGLGSGRLSLPVQRSLQGLMAAQLSGLHKIVGSGQVLNPTISEGGRTSVMVNPMTLQGAYRPGRPPWHAYNNGDYVPNIADALAGIGMVSNAKKGIRGLSTLVSEPVPESPIAAYATPESGTQTVYQSGKEEQMCPGLNTGMRSIPSARAFRKSLSCTSASPTTASALTNALAAEDTVPEEAPAGVHPLSPIPSMSLTPQPSDSIHLGSNASSEFTFGCSDKSEYSLPRPVSPHQSMQHTSDNLLLPSNLFSQSDSPYFTTLTDTALAKASPITSTLPPPHPLHHRFPEAPPAANAIGISAPIHCGAAPTQTDHPVTANNSFASTSYSSSPGQLTSENYSNLFESLAPVYTPPSISPPTGMAAPTGTLATRPRKPKSPYMDVQSIWQESSALALLEASLSSAKGPHNAEPIRQPASLAPATGLAPPSVLASSHVSGEHSTASSITPRAPRPRRKSVLLTGTDPAVEESNLFHRQVRMMLLSYVVLTLCLIGNLVAADRTSCESRVRWHSIICTMPLLLVLQVGTPFVASLARPYMQQRMPAITSAMFVLQYGVMLAFHMLHRGCVRPDNVFANHALFSILAFLHENISWGQFLLKEGVVILGYGMLHLLWALQGLHMHHHNTYMHTVMLQQLALLTVALGVRRMLLMVLRELKQRGQLNGSAPIPLLSKIWNVSKAAAMERAASFSRNGSFGRSMSLGKSMGLDRVPSLFGQMNGETSSGTASVGRSEGVMLQTQSSSSSGQGSGQMMRRNALGGKDGAFQLPVLLAKSQDYGPSPLGKTPSPGTTIGSGEGASFDASMTADGAGALGATAAGCETRIFGAGDMCSEGVSLAGSAGPAGPVVRGLLGSSIPPSPFQSTSFQSYLGNVITCVRLQATKRLSSFIAQASQLKQHVLGHVETVLQEQLNQPYAEWRNGPFPSQFEHLLRLALELVVYVKGPSDETPREQPRVLRASRSCKSTFHLVTPADSDPPQEEDPQNWKNATQAKQLYTSISFHSYMIRNAGLSLVTAAAVLSHVFMTCVVSGVQCLDAHKVMLFAWAPLTLLSSLAGILLPFTGAEFFQQHCATVNLCCWLVSLLAWFILWQFQAPLDFQSFAWALVGALQTHPSIQVFLLQQVLNSVVLWVSLWLWTIRGWEGSAQPHILSQMLAWAAALLVRAMLPTSNIHTMPSYPSVQPPLVYTQKQINVLRGSKSTDEVAMRKAMAMSIRDDLVEEGEEDGDLSEGSDQMGEAGKSKRALDRALNRSSTWPRKQTPNLAPPLEGEQSFKSSMQSFAAELSSSFNTSPTFAAGSPPHNFVQGSPSHTFAQGSPSDTLPQDSSEQAMVVPHGHDSDNKTPTFLSGLTTDSFHGITSDASPTATGQDSDQQEMDARMTSAVAASSALTAGASLSPIGGTGLASALASGTKSMTKPLGSTKSVHFDLEPVVIGGNSLSDLPVVLAAGVDDRVVSSDAAAVWKNALMGLGLEEEFDFSDAVCAMADSAMSSSPQLPKAVHLSSHPSQTMSSATEQPPAVTDTTADAASVMVGCADVAGGMAPQGLILSPQCDNAVKLASAYVGIANDAASIASHLSGNLPSLEPFMSCTPCSGIDFQFSKPGSETTSSEKPAGILSLNSGPARSIQLPSVFKSGSLTVSTSFPHPESPNPVTPSTTRCPWQFMFAMASWVTLEALNMLAHIISRQTPIGPVSQSSELEMSSRYEMLVSKLVTFLRLQVSAVMQILVPGTGHSWLASSLTTLEEEVSKAPISIVSYLMWTVLTCFALCVPYILGRSLSHKRWVRLEWYNEMHSKLTELDLAYASTASAEDLVMWLSKSTAEMLDGCSAYLITKMPPQEDDIDGYEVHQVHRAWAESDILANARDPEMFLSSMVMLMELHPYGKIASDPKTLRTIMKSALGNTTLTNRILTGYSQNLADLHKLMTDQLEVASWMILPLDFGQETLGLMVVLVPDHNAHYLHRSLSLERLKRMGMIGPNQPVLDHYFCKLLLDMSQQLTQLMYLRMTIMEVEASNNLIQDIMPLDVAEHVKRKLLSSHHHGPQAPNLGPPEQQLAAAAYQMAYGPSTDDVSLDVQAAPSSRTYMFRNLNNALSINESEADAEEDEEEDNDSGIGIRGIVYKQWHPSVSVLFADIVGYTSMSQELEPDQVMAMLHKLFSKYDKQCARWGVYKVETIGDCYMACAGLTDNSTAHAHSLVQFGKAMLKAARKCECPTGGHVRIRVGIHTGRVMSGVVGSIRARYCLFGDTVNTASRMESTGVPEAIQISEFTYKLLDAEHKREWIPRGPITVKGKGEMFTYLYNPNTSSASTAGS